jgi:hypothetical protein
LQFLFMALSSSEKSNVPLSCLLTVCISETHQISLSDKHEVTCSWRGSPQFWSLMKKWFNILQVLKNDTIL